MVTAPRWDGPLHRDGLVIGLALEVVAAGIPLAAGALIAAAGLALPLCRTTPGDPR